MESNKEEKRIVSGYEIRHSFHIGDREILLGMNKKEKIPYLVADCFTNNDFGVERYENGVGSDDYLEIMELFCNRLTMQVEQVKTQRAERGITAESLTAEHCIAGSNRGNYENKIVIIKPNSLRAEYATIDNQLVLALHGNGCNPDAHGRAIYCAHLFIGEIERWERQDILGVADMEKIPKWAQEKAEKLIVARHKKQERNCEVER